ncbi:hypothetical protein [Acidiphilium sp. MT5]
MTHRRWIKRIMLLGGLVTGLLGLSGCGLSAGADAGIGAGANLVALTTIHRTIPDAIVSLALHRDCSLARLDAGKSYCRNPAPLPPPIPYCTRTLGQVTCWSDPENLPDHAPPVAEGPNRLSRAQLANRNHGWP